MNDKNQSLNALESRMSNAHVRGQWQVGTNRPETAVTGSDGRRRIEPVPMAEPCRWPWSDMKPILEGACHALPESFTARRSLLFMNPGLDRGTTQTITAGIQIIQPGEIAWAHRHSINALRFAIQGNDNVFTVVNGKILPMNPYDLILTPGWCWHDHHNPTAEPAIWLDVLDVPFIHGINQNYYEELGETVQDRHNDIAPVSSYLLRARDAQNASKSRRPFRYPWKDVLNRLESLDQQPPDPAEGIVLEYVNPVTGGATLPTLNCMVQLLPPGFHGVRRRCGSSSVHFVIGGEGEIVFDNTTLPLSKHDGLSIPNWTWHQFKNPSAQEPLYLFTVTDRPILDAFGLYREQVMS